MAQNPPSQRQLKVGETIRHALCDIFIREQFYDPVTREELSITISEVRISPDLHKATVFFMPLGGKNKERVQKTLEAISPQIRHYLSKMVKLRYLPVLTFRIDKVFDQGTLVETLLNNPKVRQDLES